MAYTLAAKKLWPGFKDILVEFLFLKFPRSPSQQIKVTKEQLDGFEYYMEHMFHIVNNYDENVAKTNFAEENPKNRWLCQAGKTWVCPYRDAKDYYVLLNAEGEILKSAFLKKELKANKNQKIEKRKYEGCPAHSNKNQSLGSEFDFDEPDSDFNF